MKWDEQQIFVNRRRTVHYKQQQPKQQQTAEGKKATTIKLVSRSSEKIII